MEEIWKDVAGYEGIYRINNKGVVMSHDKIARCKCNGKRVIKAHNLTPRLDSRNRYYLVDLCKDGVKTTHILHRLIAKTFLDNPYNLPQVNHIDGNKHNNDVTNLEWCTPSYNMKHAIRMGLKIDKGLKGVDNGRCKLTELDVSLIRKRYNEGESISNISKDYIHLQETTSKNPYKASWSMISYCIKNGWTHIS